MEIAEDAGDQGVCALDWCEEPARGGPGMQSFCSARHYHWDWRIRTGRSQPPPRRVCELPECGTPFMAKTANQRYCSYSHRDRHAYLLDPEPIRERDRRLRQDPEFVRKSAERARAWAQANPDRARAHQRARSLRDKGLTPAGFDVLTSQFSGTCWLCRKPMVELTRGGRPRHLHVDHDHAHAEGDPAGVRGLLDTWCNTRLQIVEDTAYVTQLRVYLAARATFLPPPARPGDTVLPSRLGMLRLTRSQVTAIRAENGGLCAACGEPEPLRADGTRRPLSIDHDHAKRPGEPGFIRGAICNRCNSALGVLENVTWWSAATDYLTWAPPLAQQLLAGPGLTHVAAPR